MPGTLGEARVPSQNSRNEVAIVRNMAKKILVTGETENPGTTTAII
jgi:hypothetical protein